VVEHQDIVGLKRTLRVASPGVAKKTHSFAPSDDGQNPIDEESALIHGTSVTFASA
jgi:hypothetical protein